MYAYIDRGCGGNAVIFIYYYLHVGPASLHGCSVGTGERGR